MLKRLMLLVPVMLAVSLPAWAAHVRVRADATALRAAAADTAQVVMQLKAGAALDLVDAGRDWFKVRDPRTGAEGYVQASAVDLLPGPVGSEAQAGQGTAPVRPAGPGGPARQARRPPSKSDWTDAGFFSVSGLYQAGASSAHQSMSWTYFGETATLGSSLPAANAPGFDVGGGYRVWRNMEVGASVSVASKSGNAAVTGSIPHPLYANAMRSVSETLSTTRTETGVHLHVGWVVPMPPKMTFMVFGGPAVFFVSQTMLAGTSTIQFTETYPYDTVTLNGKSSTDSSKTAVGFSGGADIAYYFSRTVGVGGFVRYARATVKWSDLGVETNAGGAQVGIGLRVKLGVRKPAPPAKPLPKPATPPAK